MNELLFNVMDVPNEAKKILDEKSDEICKGMTESERKAYDFGLATVLGLIRALLEIDEEPAVHIKGLNEMQEVDIAELEKIFLK
jgi:hypothetical protein